MKLPTAEEVQQAVEALERLVPRWGGPGPTRYHPSIFGDHVAVLERVAEAWRNGVEVKAWRDPDVWEAMQVEGVDPLLDGDPGLLLLEQPDA